MRQDPPSDLVQQHKEVVHRLHWQKAQLERAPPALLSGTKHSQKTRRSFSQQWPNTKFFLERFSLELSFLKHICRICTAMRITFVYKCQPPRVCDRNFFFFFTIFAEYESVLRRLVQGLADSVKKYSSQGNRVSAGSESPWMSLLLLQMLYICVKLTWIKMDNACLPPHILMHAWMKQNIPESEHCHPLATSVGAWFWAVGTLQQSRSLEFPLKQKQGSAVLHWRSITTK